MIQWNSDSGFGCSGSRQDFRRAQAVETLGEFRYRAALLRRLVLLCSVIWCGHSSQPATAAPDHTKSILTSVFPAGGQQGTSVTVRFTGTNGGFVGADTVIIDGPPGVTASEVKPAGKDQIEATLTIAADAVPGRRMLRVKGGTNGLTNFRWFFVTPLSEYVEQSKNNTPATAEEILQPVIVNGRVDPLLDQDCYRFEAVKGQNLVIAVMSHWMDALGYGRSNAGFSDTSLELLDRQGRVLAEAGDVLGYDPLIEYTIPADGFYTARVSGMGFKGHPEMIYRLTIGEVAYPTSIFPAGGQRGRTVEVELSGPNIPSGHRQKVAVDDDPFPVQYVSIDGPYAGVFQLPFIRGRVPERTVHPNETPLKLDLPTTYNGRIDRPGDEDWFEVALKKGDGITLDIMAQRHLRSPVDMLVEVFDAKRNLITSNDDGIVYQGECTHDFVPFDSFLPFRAKKSGTFLFRVSEQSGASGPRCVYRLTATRLEPDFRIYQWPDTVAVWGPGSTAGFVVETHRLGGLKADVELHIEGLPDGWTGSTSNVYASQYRDPRGAFGHKVFLTITAPPTASVGDMVSFKVVGTATQDGRTIQRTAQALTHYSWGEPHRFRYSSQSRIIVCAPAGQPLASSIAEITAKPGDMVEIPVRVNPQSDNEAGKLRLSVNRATTHFKCSIGAPVNVSVTNGEAAVPINIPSSYKPGIYEVLISHVWASETRKGLPGPCTRVIRVRVEK